MATTYIQWIVRKKEREKNLFPRVDTPKSKTVVEERRKAISQGWQYHVTPSPSLQYVDMYIYHQEQRKEQRIIFIIEEWGGLGRESSKTFYKSCNHLTSPPFLPTQQWPISKLRNTPLRYWWTRVYFESIYRDDQLLNFNSKRRVGRVGVIEIGMMIGKWNKKRKMPSSFFYYWKATNTSQLRRAYRGIFLLLLNEATRTWNGLKRGPMKNGQKSLKSTYIFNILPEGSIEPMNESIDFEQGRPLFIKFSSIRITLDITRY